MGLCCLDGSFHRDIVVHRTTQFSVRAKEQETGLSIERLSAQSGDRAVHRLIEVNERSLFNKVTSAVDKTFRNLKRSREGYDVGAHSLESKNQTYDPS